ncbi:hypothetical protein EST38_g14074 [Candolleomyces aberdarensis]|uniref:Nephrocystin 3-like N-terminal domain-containing protein n=1 Tax=Candolleomyces aberdarensis TaxID=2316362 RepID=A0A4Q2D0M5_9AGAR|nr:hypothetical protein EST38_g14074 [Candolleomyces aberdarensis]
MDPPKRPRRRDEAKELFKSPVKFLKERFSSRDPSPSRSRPALHPKGRVVSNLTYEGVKTTLRRIVDVSDVFPPLKSTAAALLVICNTIDAYGENHEEFNALLKRVEVLSQIIDKSPPNVETGVQDRFSGLSRTLEQKKEILQDKLNPNRSGVDRAFLTDQDKQAVLKLTQEIRLAIEIAMFDATIENMTETLQIVKGVDWLKERIEIIEDHTGAMRNIEEAVRSLKKSNTFEKLGGVEGAEFDNAQRGSGCTPGSRISLLAMLLVWAKDLRSPHLFWLSGLAGTGKTTVSKTFCSQLNNRGLLGASFFCHALFDVFEHEESLKLWANWYAFLRYRLRLLLMSFQVPVYDARNFTVDFDNDLEHIDELPRWRDEIPFGSFTVVAYTVAVYKAQSSKWHVSLNIKWAMVLGIPEV